MKMETVIKQRKKQFEKQKQTLRRRLTEEEDELLAKSRLDIISLAPLILLQKLKNGDLSAAEVLEAFQAKSLEVTERINCITEFIPEAESWAENLDLLKENERGPLHGLPVSIKESIDVKGCDTTLGLAKYVHCPVGSHSAVVEVLLKKGAVPFCKTNIPQTLLSFTCSNPVFGTTLHPDDHTRTPGGSSGGEGALIAAGGSVLGIGSDLAGSSRVPASLSGCVGIKPTLNRLSGKGFMKALAGMVGNVSVPGVMGRDVSIVNKCLEVLLEENDLYKLDVETVPLSWNTLKVEDRTPLTIGWYDSFDHLPPTPGVQRAVHLARDALSRRGHKLIQFKATDGLWLMENIIKVVTADGGSSMLAHIEGQDTDQYLGAAFEGFGYGRSKKKFLKFMIGRHSKLYPGMYQTDMNSCFDLWKQIRVRQKYMHKFSAKMKEQNLDLLLGPTYPVPAPQHDVPEKIGPCCIYTCMYNYLDFPAMSVPVTRESEEDQQNLKDYFPEDDLLFRVMKKATLGATGLPIGAQLAGLPWQEEMVCRGAKELELALEEYHNGALNMSAFESD